MSERSQGSVGSDLIITLCVSRRGWGHQLGIRSIGCPEEAMEREAGRAWHAAVPPTAGSGARLEDRAVLSGHVLAHSAQPRGCGSVDGKPWSGPAARGWHAGLACGALPLRTAVAQSPARFLALLGVSRVRQPAEVRPVSSGAQFVWSVARPLCEALARPPGSMVSCSGLGPGPREDHPWVSHVPLQLRPPPRSSAPLPCPTSAPSRLLGLPVLW